jgi:hypothetical protein
VRKPIADARLNHGLDFGAIESRKARVEMRDRHAHCRRLVWLGQLDNPMHTRTVRVANEHGVNETSAFDDTIRNSRT